MQLRFRGAGTDRAPGHEVREVLRRENIEVFHTGRHALFGECQQQAARGAQALVDVVAVVEIGVVDQTLPADGGPRLLEIHAHHDQQILRELLFGRGQALRVFQRCARVVDRTRPDHDQQTVVTTGEHVLNLRARLGHGLGGAVRQRILGLHLCRHGDRTDGLDTQVFGDAFHGNNRG